MSHYLFALLFLLMPYQLATAQSLFSDDFQDGDTAGWQGSPRKGDIRLTSYKKNISMRLQHDAYAIAIVPINNFQRFIVSVDFAAQSLKNTDYCILEAGFVGETWTEIGRIGDGQDDGISLHNVSGPALTASGQEKLAIRLRISAGRDRATCWADNVRVTGQADERALAQKIPLATLLSGAPVKAAYSTVAFQRPADAGPALQEFSGQLQLKEAHLADGFAILKDQFHYAQATGKLKQLPVFTIDFVSAGDALIPVQRGPQAGDHPDWEWIFEPGSIWSMPGDEGWSRAALPIALQERNANCLHQGLISFAFKDGEISRAVVQIGAETCAYLKFDLWSKLDVSFRPGDGKNASKIIADYEQELSNRLPRLPLATLENIDLTQIGSAIEVSPENMTAYGFFADGHLYASDCQTRHGRYPFCAAMPLPSYSMAKSIVASIGLMRLEKLYPGARQALISDYVPECKAQKWGDVTFEHALDMTTGNYTTAEYNKDEEASTTWDFMSEETHAKKISQACNLHKRQAKPGTKFVYHTTDTYILGTAMQEYLRQKTGKPKADLYDDVLRPIWRALKLGPLLDTTRRTNDVAAQAFTGWGLTLHADDLVRVSQFLQNGGQIEGESWLDQELLSAALFSSADDLGTQANGKTLRYRAGFWAYNAGPFMGCKEDLWLPSMSGFGGLASVLLPNGQLYFYISDGHQYGWRRAAKASNQLKPFCEMRQ